MNNLKISTLSKNQIKE